MKTLSTFLFLLLLTFTQTAAANLIVIDFVGDPEGEGQNLVYQESGITLTVSAWTTNVNTDQDQIQPWTFVDNGFGVSVREFGLGVKSSADDGSTLDGGYSDEAVDDPDEGLLLVFSHQVMISDFVLSSLSDNDDVNFSYASILSRTQVETTDIFQDIGAGDGPFGMVSMNQPVSGYAFMLWVDGADDDVRLADIAFTHIPEPSALWLFLLAGLMLGRRFK